MVDLSRLAIAAAAAGATCILSGGDAARAQAPEGSYAGRIECSPSSRATGFTTGISALIVEDSFSYSRRYFDGTIETVRGKVAKDGRIRARGYARMAVRGIDVDWELRVANGSIAGDGSMTSDDGGVRSCTMTLARVGGTAGSQAAAGSGAGQPSLESQLSQLPLGLAQEPPAEPPPAGQAVAGVAILPSGTIMRSDAPAAQAPVTVSAPPALSPLAVPVRPTGAPAPSAAAVPPIPQVAALPPAAGAPELEIRLALVVGNAGYKDMPLANPVNDAKLVGGTLRRLGFQVQQVADADQRAMKRAIQDFGERLEKSAGKGIGLFFYAGHGIQAGGKNYLIPVGAQIRREADLEIEAVNAAWVLNQMEYARAQVNIVILDACRNNPLQRSFRSAVQGLARMDAPRGTIVAYSTAPDQVAADGQGTNSPYSAALVQAMQRAGTPVEQMFKLVRRSVLQATADQQIPWESSSLTGDFFFLPPVGRAGG